MERTAAHYWVGDYGVTLPSSYYADCQFFGTEIVMAMVSRVCLTLRFDSHQEPSMTLVLIAVHFEVICEENVLLP